MSAFISASEIEAAKRLKKEQRRAAREEILREAKESYEREKKRQELKRERGEDVWVAPAISKRLGLHSKDDALTPERKKPRKHKKEHKKHKKHKTKKSKLERDSGSSSAFESESGEEMWVEKGAGEIPNCETPLEPQSPSTKAPPLQREDWMTMPLAPSDLSMTKLAERRETQENKKQEKKEEVCLVQTEKHWEFPHMQPATYWNTACVSCRIVYCPKYICCTTLCCSLLNITAVQQASHCRTPFALPHSLTECTQPHTVVDMCIKWGGEG